MKFSKKLTTKNICNIGIGTALYVVLSATVKIPLIGHIQTDLGYVAFGVYLSLFGIIGTFVGALGCVIESLMFSGWFPVGWLLGQVFIGISCGAIFKTGSKIKNKTIKIIVYVVVATIAVFIGIGLIKTIVECYLYGIPFEVKFVKNLIAFVADTPPMILGILIGNQFKNKLK